MAAPGLRLVLPTLLAAVAALGSDHGADTCAAGGGEGGCVSGVTEDDVAEDVKKMCPIFDAPRTRGVVEGALRLVPSLKPVLRALSLWPADVELGAWCDEYVFDVYVIIGRILLGMYSTRNKDYVRVPSSMLEASDVIHMERVHTPHTDVDGAPNFYAFEFLVPQRVLGAVFVPLYTCFYGLLRRLALTPARLGADLSGEFDDMLNDTNANTWDAVLQPGQSKRDWVLSFYENARTLDGTPLWPKQMTDFSVYFKKDEWDDRLEYAIAFHLIGTHRVESGSWTFPDVAGFESVTLPYRLPLNSLSEVPVRPGLGVFGVDLYFNKDGLPVLLMTPSQELIVRGDPRWQYWKFVWRSSLVTGITLIDHLHMAHYRAATLISRSVRTALAPDHPQRRFLSIFTFGSLFINAQAVHTLLGPNHMLHRATPFREFSSLSSVVPQGIDDTTAVPAIQALANETAWAQLDPRLQATPFYADGRLLVGAIRTLVDGVLELIWHILCKDGKFEPSFARFVADMMKFTFEAHYRVDPNSAGDGFAVITGQKDCHVVKHILRDRLVAFIYIVTGWHRQVGFVGDYYADPGLATMSWKDGEAFGSPRQHMIMSVINVFTSTRQPLLKEDYTHLFQGMKPDLSKEFTLLWRDFQKDLADVEAEIGRRNQHREIVNINHSPEVVECSVSK